MTGKRCCCGSTTTGESRTNVVAALILSLHSGTLSLVGQFYTRWEHFSKARLKTVPRDDFRRLCQKERKRQKSILLILVRAGPPLYRRQSPRLCYGAPAAVRAVSLHYSVFGIGTDGTRCLDRTRVVPSLRVVACSVLPAELLRCSCGRSCAAGTGRDRR